MLRACRWLLRPGGRLAFHTIFVPAGLPEAEYRRALRLGPAAVSSRRWEHLDLLRAAGFENITETDQSTEFLLTARAWLAARERHAPELAELEGEAQFKQKTGEDRSLVRAIEADLLRRSLFVAEKPR